MWQRLPALGPHLERPTHAAARSGRLARAHIAPSTAIRRKTKHAMVIHCAACLGQSPLPKNPKHSLHVKQGTPVFVIAYFPTTRLAAPVRRAAAGAGMRPCDPRARPPCDTQVSSTAQYCSRSTAAGAGPPPSGRTGCGTCACRRTRESQLREHQTRCQTPMRACKRHGRRGRRAPRPPAAHGAQRGRLQVQVLQAGLQCCLCGGGLTARGGGRHAGRRWAGRAC